MIERPTAFDPVKTTNATSGCRTRCAPTSPNPGRNASAPGGTPASRRISTSRNAMPGVCSAGLKTTQFPVTSAAVTMPAGIASGKFHGAMTEPQRLAPVVLAVVDRLADVGVGLGKRLARLEHLERREGGPAATKDGGRAKERRGALA